MSKRILYTKPYTMRRYKDSEWRMILHLLLNVSAELA